MTYREVHQDMPDGRRVTMRANMKYRAVQLHHPDLRNCIYTVELHDKPMSVPELCGVCGLTHGFKAVHLNVNANGDVTVTQFIYDLLKRYGVLKPFRAVKEVVPRPTAIGMGFLDASAQVLRIGGAPQPQQHVVSREHGKVGQHG